MLGPRDFYTKLVSNNNPILSNQLRQYRPHRTAVHFPINLLGIIPGFSSKSLAGCPTCSHHSARSEERREDYTHNESKERREEYHSKTWTRTGLWRLLYPERNKIGARNSCSRLGKNKLRCLRKKFIGFLGP